MRRACASPEGTTLKPFAVAVAACLAAAGASADDASERAVADPIVVTATRTPEPLSTVVRPVEIIPGPVFDAAGQDTLTELLQSRANVQIAATGGAGQPSSVFIRGANSNHTLVLLDGIRINNAAGGTVPFENLRNEQFARAEVVPGPLSSLYGSDALGGAIQLFTHRWPEAPHLRGAVGCGRYDTRTASGGVSAGTQTTGLTVNASYIETDGFSATNATEPFGSFNPDDDSHRNANLSANLVHRFAPDHELALSAYYTDARTEFGSNAFVAIKYRAQ